MLNPHVFFHQNHNTVAINKMNRKKLKDVFTHFIALR